MGTVLVTSRSFSGGDIDQAARLSAAGHDVVRGDPGHDIDKLRPLLNDAVAWIAGTAPVSAEHLDAAPALRIVARYGVGFEAVDVHAASSRDIIVTNTPGANSGAVADHAVGLMLAALRFTVDGDRRVRNGDWGAVRGRELGSQTLGIVGFGRIGQGVARRVSGFGCTVLAYDPVLSDDAIRSAGASPVPLAELCERSSVLTLHAPGGDCILTEQLLEQILPGLVIVNTARPDLIDEKALAGSLRRGSVGAFAADTLVGDVAGTASPLLASDLADRVTITPHLGAQTVEAVDGMGELAVDNVIAVLNDAPARYPVFAL